MSARAAKHRRTTGSRPRLAELSTIHEGYALSFDGTRLWYKSFGSGLPLIFCNGLGCSTFYWKHIYTHFRRSCQTVLFDWRGHGQSGPPRVKKNITIDALADDILAVMKKLRIKRAVLAGHSMGTQVLYRFYEKYPQRVRALIPCCGTFGNAIETFYNTGMSKHFFTGIYVFIHLFPRLANSISHLLSKTPFWFQMGSVLQMLNPGLADKKVLREYIEHFTSMDPVFLAKLARSMQEYNAEPLLKKIRVPTLIVAGENDRFTPVWLSKKMHHLIAKSELLVIKKGTHVALIEQPALINLRIEKFIKERL